MTDVIVVVVIVAFFVATALLVPALSRVADANSADQAELDAEGDGDESAVLSDAAHSGQQHP
jgi:hypothetical protein